MKHWMFAMALICLGSTKASAWWETRNELLGDCTSYSVSIPGVITTPVALIPPSLVGATTTFATLQEGRTMLYVQNSSQPVTSEIFMQVGLSSTSPSGDLSLVAPTGLTRSAGIYIPAKGTFSAPWPARNQSGRVLVPYVLTGAVDTGKVQVTQCKP